MPVKGNLLFLHGALGSSVQLEPLAEILKDQFKITLYNFQGHGGKPIPEEPLSIRLFADELKSLIEKTRIAPVDIFVYSMGGYVALYTALHYPGLIGKIFTLGTKFDWTEESSNREVRMLDPDKILEKVPAFAKELEARHSPEDWKHLLAKTSEMMINLGKEPELKFEEMAKIENRIMVSVGDRDNMVSISETERAYRSLNNSAMLVLPDTAHPIERINQNLIKRFIEDFFL